MNVSAPTYIKPEMPFQINATIAYPQPLPNALSTYPASSCNATIKLPANLSLAQGEVQKKVVGEGFLEAGANFTMSWILVANFSVWDMITIEVEGLVSGLVGAHESYTPYEYSDRIGVAVDSTVGLAEDGNAPFIGIPSRAPEGDVEPNQEVKVLVNVTDMESGVQNVTLFYTINNETTWENRTMNYNQSTSLYEATILGQKPETCVRFKIVAYDWVGNNATRDGTEPYCTYQVIPEFPSSTIMPTFMVLTMLTIFYAKRRISRKKELCIQNFP